MTNDKEKARLTVELPDSEDELLELAARGAGESKARIIRIALRLYYSLASEVGNGGKVQIVKPDGTVLQLMI